MRCFLLRIDTSLIRKLKFENLLNILIYGSSIDNLNLGIFQKILKKPNKGYLQAINAVGFFGHILEVPITHYYAIKCCHFY